MGVFCKNIDNELKKKIVYADEFWTMVDNEQTVSFAEKWRVELENEMLASVLLHKTLFES